MSMACGGSVIDICSAKDQLLVPSGNAARSEGPDVAEDPLHVLPAPLAHVRDTTFAQ